MKQMIFISYFPFINFSFFKNNIGTSRENTLLGAMMHSAVIRDEWVERVWLHFPGVKWVQIAEPSVFCFIHHY